MNMQLTDDEKGNGNQKALKARKLIEK